MNRPAFPARTTALAALLAAVTAGCTTAPAPPATPGARSLEVQEVPCADDIRGTMIGELRCDLVVVPPRPGTGGTSVSVHVTRLQPPGGASDQPPILVAPGTGTPNYLGLAPMAQRTGREIVIVDARGTGHSRPALTCPEVDAYALDELRSTAPGAEPERDYVDAVTRCADRHRADGVDTADFTVAQVAADLAEVRRALGIDRWVVIGLGGGARAVPELMRLDAAAVEALLLDSPELPGHDVLRAGASRTSGAVRDLLASCASDPRCAARHPRARSLWARARAATAARPLVVRIVGLGRVRVDEAALVRIVRSMVSDGGSSGLAFTPAAVPAFLQEIVTGRGDLLRGEVAPLLAMQDAFCLGHAPDCLQRMRLAPGAYLSVMCDSAREGGTGSTGAAPSPDPLLVDVFGARVTPKVCERWGVSPASWATPLEWPTPTLVMVGRYGPYVSAADLRGFVDGLPAGSLVVDPAGADNVLTRTECMLTLRRQWIDDPVADVAAPDCLDGERVEWYLPAP